MKCPECGKEDKGRVECQDPDIGTEFAYFCTCGHEWGHVRAIDPAVLLDLVKGARKRGQNVFIGKSHFLNAICSCLSGNPGPLKALAGVE
jgi:hypothetical protein